MSDYEACRDAGVRRDNPEMYDGPVISGEPCKIHAAHYMFNDVGRLVCVGCLVWRDERVWPDEVAKLNLQIHELQDIVRLCVDQGGLSFHVEGGKCPEDDTCDCPDAKRVSAAMKGYTEKRVCESRTGTDDKLRCVLEPGHGGFHSDGNLIRWDGK